jgi:prophage tail gpP-like protein
MRDKLSVIVNGAIYENFRQVEIKKSIENLSSSYSFKITQPDIFNFIPGNTIKILIANQPIITGYLESVSIDGSDTSFDILINGRDKTADLIDSSAVFTSSEFTNLSYLQFAQKLTTNFKINIISKTEKANTKFSKITLQQGTVFEELEREARRIGVFLYSDINGDLVIDEIGNSINQTRLVCPGNIIKFNSDVDISSRFSEYTIKGQQTSANDDSLTADQQVSVRAKCQDQNIERYRPFVLIASGAINTAQAKARIEWEAAVRAARSQTLSIQLDGWTDSGANLWQVNQLIAVDIAPIRFRKYMLIKSISFTYDEITGQTTDLELVHPDSYLPEPVIKKQDLEDSILLK